MNDLIKIDQSKCTITSISAQFPDSLTIDDWKAIGLTFSKVSGAYLWWIGDWLSYGCMHYGDKSRLSLEYAELLGLQPDTIRKAIHVSQSCQVVIRMHNLSWNHHYEVSGMQPNEQKKWLALADENKWSVGQLRMSIRKASGEWKEEFNKPTFNPLEPMTDLDRWFRRQGDWAQRPVEQRKVLVEQIEKYVLPWYEQIKGTL